MSEPLPLPHLVHMARGTWEMAVADDNDIFFPKIVIGRDGGSSLVQIVGDFDFDVISNALYGFAAEGPIDWLALTVDGYHYDSTVEGAPTDLILSQYLSGQISLKDLFDQNCPGVYESLVVTRVIQPDVSETMYLPYVRNGRDLRWLEDSPVIEDQGRFVKTMLAVLKVARRPGPDWGRFGLVDK